MTHMWKGIINTQKHENLMLSTIYTYIYDSHSFISKYVCMYVCTF